MGRFGARGTWCATWPRQVASGGRHRTRKPSSATSVAPRVEAMRVSVSSAEEQSSRGGVIDLVVPTRNRPTELATTLAGLARRHLRPDDRWLAYKIAWVGGCVQYERAVLDAVGASTSGPTCLPRTAEKMCWCSTGCWRGLAWPASFRSERCIWSRHDRAGPRYAFHPVVTRSSPRCVRWANKPCCTQPPRTRACAAAMNVRIWCSSASCAAARSRRARSRRSWRCCVQRDSLFCAVRGFSSSVGRRSGRHGPDYPRAPPPGIRPRRVGFARPSPSPG